jgi:flavin reductase (DIM6/NTAB) family NADH-FMN oxidoreductase RutF
MSPSPTAATDSATLAVALPAASATTGAASCPPDRAERGKRDLRSTLGSFATGITVLTALSPDGKPIGLTISSFNSVSLEPPLILWSLSANSPSLEAFRRASHYAVNVLSSEQQALSDRFATRDQERFGGLPWRAGVAGVPLLDGCCAWFECANTTQHAGGDHLIFVGQVERFALGETQSPLIFHNGRYRRLAP